MTDALTSIAIYSALSEQVYQMVDGRFRLACILQILMRARQDAVILVHDYVTRPQYHPAGPFTRELCRVDDLVALQRRPDFEYDRAAAVMLQHRFDTA